MAIYNKNGTILSTAYSKQGTNVQTAYDIGGVVVYDNSSQQVDYDTYSFTQKWSSKGENTAQGLDVFDGKVFWVSKSGNSTIPSNCYVWNLSDGSQALANPYITVYSGHGNNLCFAPNSTMYATSAYTPDVYVNEFTNEWAFSLAKTLFIDDGCIDCDACIDDTDETILWTLGHTSYQSGEPFLISKWDLTDLTDNGDGTYSPANLQTISVPSPTNRYFQGLKKHDGLLWYGNGNGGVSAYVRAINPCTGVEEHIIDLETTTEPEGVAWVADADVAGGYAMYVGFQGMMMRKYTFAMS